MGVPFSVSNDGGKTFKSVRSPGGDHHALWIDPANSNYLIKGFDQGVAVSYDKGQNWRYFQNELNRLPVLQPQLRHGDARSRSTAPCRTTAASAARSTSAAAATASRPRSSSTRPGGEGSNHAIDPTDPNIVYSAGFYGTISRAEYDKPGAYPGAPYQKELLPVLYENEPPLRGQWLAPFILSSHNPNILYHGMQFVFRSLDRGDTWERISPDLTTNDAATRGDIRYQTLFTISESPIKYGLLYAGTDDGRLWVTRDGGKAWTEITAGLAPGKWMSRVVASAYDLGTVYLTQNGKRDDDFTPYVWKSNDYGKTWTIARQGHPGRPGQRHPRGPRQQGHPLRGHGHGRLCHGRRREGLDGPGRQPADGLRPRPGHPPAGQHRRHRHSRPRHVGPRREHGQQQVFAEAFQLRGLSRRAFSRSRASGPSCS